MNSCKSVGWRIGSWFPQHHGWAWITALVVSSLLMSGCAGPSPAVTAELTPTPPVLNYENPVFSYDFPDPFLLRTNGTYYGYATNARDMNIQVIRSEDLVDWERVGQDGDALPQLPGWAAPRKFLTWAPSVLQQDDAFILYYTTRYVAGGRQCISYALSDSPEGPFVDPNDQPFVCQLEQGGSIDPEPFVDDDGKIYLLWKSDGNCCGLPVWIYAQRLTDDGLNLVGDTHRLITRDQAWEKPLVENPSMTYHAGRYYLIYSANWWESGDYAVGYAVCETPLGPCEKPQNKPIVESVGRTVGPGGASFFRDAGNALWIAHHAWTLPSVGYPVGQRSLHLGRITFVNGAPTLHRPEAQQQP